VEQQSAPWRVFDAPAVGAEAAARTPEPGGKARGDAAPPARNLPLALAGVAGSVAIVGLAVIVALSGAGAGLVEGPDSAVAANAGDVPNAAGQIVVDVAGAVVKPGVYRLAAGARIGDAIDAAGGFSARVDVGRVSIELNLAAALSDGAQIRVPSRDDPPSTSGGAGGSAASGGTSSKFVNINTATETELDALPGIGPVTAGKIIESRSGAPFRTIDELRERGIVGEKTLEKLKPLITVG